MHGPERWGCVLFGLNHLEEQPVHPGEEPESSDNHILRIRGELFLGVTRPSHRLPRNIWDRQRQGGRLSDGVTQVWWIIHDMNMPGRVGERYFEVVFVGRHWCGTVPERTRDFQTWRRFVRREWSNYLRAGRRQFTSHFGRRFMLDGGSGRLMATLRYVRYDYCWNEHDADRFHRAYQREHTLAESMLTFGVQTNTGRQGRQTNTRRGQGSRGNNMPRTILEELVLEQDLLL